MAHSRRQGRLAEWRDTIGRVRAAYQSAHGRPCRLLSPRRYTEKVQWRKLFDLDPRYTILNDKLAVRDFIARRVGDAFLTPLLWAGGNDVPLLALERPYIVKSTHASGHIFRVRCSDVIDCVAAQKTFRDWLSEDYGAAWNEPAYGSVPRKLLVERLVMRPDGTPPIERKVWVFHGRVRLVQTLINDGTQNHHAAFHNRNWQRLNWYLRSPPNPGPFEAPPQLATIIEIAEALGAGFDHVRVDFYDTADRIWIGEMTICPYSGLVPFAPDEVDFMIGSYWQIRRPLWRAIKAVLFQRHEIRRPSSIDI